MNIPCYKGENKILIRLILSLYIFIQGTKLYVTCVHIKASIPFLDPHSQPSAKQHTYTCIRV